MFYQQTYIYPHIHYLDVIGVLVHQIINKVSFFAYTENALPD